MKYILTTLLLITTLSLFSQRVYIDNIVRVDNYCNPNQTVTIHVIWHTISGTDPLDIHAAYSFGGSSPVYPLTPTYYTLEEINNFPHYTDMYNGNQVEITMIEYTPWTFNGNQWFNNIYNGDHTVIVIKPGLWTSSGWPVGYCQQTTDVGIEQLEDDEILNDEIYDLMGRIVEHREPNTLYLIKTKNGYKKIIIQ